MAAAGTRVVSSSDRDLGLDTAITRKDFLNASLLGAGGLLLSAVAPALARAAATQSAARRLDRLRRRRRLRAIERQYEAGDSTRRIACATACTRSCQPMRSDTGELYDVIVVGGGIAGLAAAYTIAKSSGGAKTCLVIENHPIFGGGAKQNEFLVNGVRLVGPQASNQFGVPSETGTSITSETWRDFGLPRSFAYQDVDPSVGGLRIPLDNYAHMDGVNETQVDVGYFFDEKTGATKPTWVRNIWQNDLADAPFSPAVRADLLRWRNDERRDD